MSHPQFTPKDIARIESYIDKAATCFAWTGHVDEHGYGYITLKCRDGKFRSLRAPRVLWELTNGPIPDGQYICHHCDNPNCVRPDHLFLGSHEDNMRDMREKGRAATGDRNGKSVHPESILRGDAHPNRQHPEKLAHGERHHMAKMTAEKVRAMRQLHAEGVSTAELVRMFGIAKPTVHQILAGRTWRHVH